jgi:hypothetical protein
LAPPYSSGSPNFLLALAAAMKVCAEMVIANHDKTLVQRIKVLVLRKNEVVSPIKERKNHT